MKPPRVLEFALTGGLLIGASQMLPARTHLQPAQSPAAGAKQAQTGARRDASETFSEEVAEQIAQQVGDGLEQHNARQLLSAFDSDAMVGYANFQNQIEAMFDQYDSFRVHLRLTEITSERDRGIVVAEFQLEETPRSQDSQSVRKRGQLRFEISRGKKGWRIVDVKPRSFFS